MTVKRDDLQSAGLEQGHIIDIRQVVRIDKNLEHRHKIKAVLIQESSIDGIVAGHSFYESCIKCDLFLRLRDIYKSGTYQTSHFFRRSACVPTTEFSCQHIRIRCLSVVAHDLQECFHCSTFSVSGSGTVKDEHTLLRGISCQGVSQRTLKEVCQIRIPAHDLLDKRVPAWTVCIRVIGNTGFHCEIILRPMLPEFQCPHIQRSIFAVEEILVPVECLHGDRIHGHVIF